MQSFACRLCNCAFRRMKRRKKREKKDKKRHTRPISRKYHDMSFNDGLAGRVDSDIPPDPLTFGPTPSLIHWVVG